MSNSVLSNLSDIVVAGTNVGGVGSNSGDSKKASEKPENKKFGPCEFGSPDTVEVHGVKQQGVAGASDPEEVKSTRSRFREVLERQMGEESGQTLNNEEQNNTSNVHADGVHNDEDVPCNMGFAGEVAGLLNTIRAGEKNGVKVKIAAKSEVTVGDLPESKQKCISVEGESGEKNGQLKQVGAGFGKGVEGSTAEKGLLKETDKPGITHQEKAKAGQGQMMEDSAADKENGLEAKIRIARGANEVNSEMKSMSDSEKPVQNMFSRQGFEGEKMPAGGTGELDEPMKMQAEHTVRDGNGEQNGTVPAALRSELRLRTARQNAAQVEEPDTVQDQQKLLNSTDVTEVLHVRAQVNNAAGVNGLTLHNAVASGVNAIDGRNQAMGNSVEASMGGVKSVGEQIIEDIGANLRGVDQEIRIMLNPPELGRVRIQFQQRGDEIVGWLQVEKAQTRYEVERELPQIVASLQQNGISVRRVEVTQNSYNEAEEHRSNTSEDYHGTGQGELGEQKFNGDGKETEEQTRATRQILTTGGQSDNSKEPYKIDDDSINVYV